MRPRGGNIFVNFLDLLKVKHTKDFSNKYHNKHPHKETFPELISKDLIYTIPGFLFACKFKLYH